MTTNRTSRRAVEFDRALTAGEAPKDPAVAKLVALAGALAAVPQRPAPAFRDALRTRLMAEAATVLPTAAAPAANAPTAGAGTTGRALRDVLAKPAMQVATGGLAAAIATAGIGVGASRSLPGDTLYGLKRTVEGWQVGLAGSAQSEANALLEHARTRLDEIKALLAAGALGKVDDTLAAMNSELASATARLLAAAPGSRAAYDQVQAVVHEFTDDLVALYPQLPPAARPQVSKTLQTLNVARARLATIPVPKPKPKPTHTPSPTQSPSPTSVLPSTPTVSPSLPTVSPSLPTVSPSLPTQLPTVTPTVTVSLPPIP